MRDYAAERASRPAGAQRVGIVDAVAPSQRGGHQGHDLIARVGSAWGAAQVKAPVNQFGKAQVQGQRGRQDQPGIVDQAVVIEAGQSRFSCVGLSAGSPPSSRPGGVSPGCPP